MLKLSIEGSVLSQSSQERIDISIQNGRYIGVTGNKRKKLIFALIGKEAVDGDIFLDEISLKQNYEEYMKQVGYISNIARRRLNGSKMRVDDLLDLAVLTKMSVLRIEDYQERKDSYLRFFGLEGKEKLEELSEEKLLILEFISIFLKNPKLIIIDDFFSLLSEEKVDEMIAFFQWNLPPDKVSVIASEDGELLQKIVEQIYVLSE